MYNDNLSELQLTLFVTIYSMAAISLYEEVPRPYHQPPCLQWNRVTSVSRRDLIKGQARRILRTLECVLEPLPSLLLQLQVLTPVVSESSVWGKKPDSQKRFDNIDDLLRKLQWHARELQPILRWQNPVKQPDTPTFELWKAFNKNLGDLLQKRGLPAMIDQISAIPIMDLTMGVYFDARLWTTCGQYICLVLSH